MLHGRHVAAMSGRSSHTIHKQASCLDAFKLHSELAPCECFHLSSFFCNLGDSLTIGAHN